VLVSVLLPVNKNIGYCACIQRDDGYKVDNVRLVGCMDVTTDVPLRYVTNPHKDTVVADECKKYFILSGHKYDSPVVRQILL